ncbi:long-chain-fatty-acid--CoA ligase [Kocuria rhizophila]|uniref:long-chain-fatty-acid--CoA ligase n=1 Tax=Kocuria rhizophila TaxID=72000 RepID=UPI0021A8177E|nr:long-chain fatty acid--CoA ligase [Kocuria rhizophila]MCT1456961.1 long-chain fatty acid--CoA ligase [Kocuria rhizophila]MCT1880863.1 long-chain fatty acid--CoA ligase [Kocuria rhizophila]MCT2250533.1 long-chain fatty acid--CoA ligase [Kocuria rhizophila]
MTNLATLLTTSAEKYGSDPVVILDDLHMSYDQLNDLSARGAALLKANGIRPGDRVALVLPNVPHMAVLYYAILRAGGIVVPLNPLLTPRELTYHFQDAGVSFVLAWEDMAEASQKAAEEIDGLNVLPISAQGTVGRLQAVDPDHEVVERADSDTAVLLYTSGTTGRPKGAELTHHNLLSNAEVAGEVFNLAHGDVMFGGLPFFHVFGQTVALNGVICAGATVTLLPRFHPAKALEVLRRDRVTIFAGVPTMYVALLHQSGQDPQAVEGIDLRAGVSGGSSMPVEVLAKFEKVFGTTVFEGYGLSETSPVVCFNQPGNVRKPGSIGSEVRGAKLRVVDGQDNEVPTGEVGELVVAGQYVMKGYWHKPEATEEAMRGGWFHTGDMARQDEDGMFFIVDRKKDMILRGGYNVYPREVEEVIYQFPGVVEAAVVGVPDEKHGEEVGAVVVFESGVLESKGKEALTRELDAFVQERVAKYKYPRIYRVTDELPKGPTGKILKRELTLDA